MRFHADTNFGMRERAWLALAVTQLATDTRDRLRIELHYDLDYSEPRDYFPKWDWFLVDLSEASELTKHFDEKYHTRVLGVCDSDFRVVYLVKERTESVTRFQHVAMHEFLHAVGLSHADDDPHAIMAAIVVPTLPLRMNQTDLDLFCQTVNCPAQKAAP
jgi:matrixin